jgi:hypothetical protein
MKHLGKFAALTLALALSASSAMAASVTGAISISGNDSYNATGITFTGNGIVLNSSGTLSLYATALTTQVGLTSFNFATASGTELFFSPTSGPSNFTFTITGPVTVTHNGSDFLNVLGNGTFTETGFDATAGSFNLTAQGNQLVSFTLGASATPEPNSLILLGSGMLSGAGMLLRRRRSIA